MRKRKWFSRLTAMILAVCVAAGCPAFSEYLRADAQADELDTLYLKEVKVFYAESYEQAQKECRAEGFECCEVNLKEGGDFVGEYFEKPMRAYLGYKTTKDPGDAITDMSLLDMKESHYEEKSYKEYLDAHIGDYTDQASKIMVLVSDFRRKYEAGSPNAIAAYDSMNMIYVDDEKSHTAEDNLLGYYILNQADSNFFAKYMQRGNSQILGHMLNYLGAAASDYNENGTTWVDKAKTIDSEKEYDAADSAMQAQLDTDCKDPALTLIHEIKTFAETYQEAADRLDKYGETMGYEADGLSADSSVADLMAMGGECKYPEYVNALQTYELLNGIDFETAGESVVKDTALLYTQNQEEATVTYTETRTLAQYFLDLARDENLEQHPQVVYRFIKGMSAGQINTLKLCGLGTLAKGLYQIEDYESRREQIIAEKTQQLKEEGFSDGKIYLWHGLDTSEYDKLIVETSDLIEAKYSGEDLNDSVNEAARKAASTLTIGLAITDITTMAISGVYLIISGVTDISLWAVAATCYTSAMTALASNLILSTTGYLLGMFLCGALHLLSIAAFLVSLGYMVYMILSAAGVFDPSPVIDYSTIPSIVYHVSANAKGKYQVRYEVVKSNATKRNMALLGLVLDGYDREELEAYSDKELLIKAVITSFFTRFSTKGSADVNDMGAFQADTDRWLTLYTTKAPAAGNPIPVVSGKSFLKTQLNSHDTPAGCVPVSLMSNSEAADINALSVSGATDPEALYLFVVMDPDKAYSSQQETDSSGAADDGEGSSADSSVSDRYIYRVRLSHADTREDAQNSLRSSDFTNIIDVNLTPYDGYTYIGYQYGQREKALTDIRVDTTGLDAITFGGASYARAGLPKYGVTPDGMALYSTSSKCAGTPITKITVETKRLEPGSGPEPVCLFSGGNAVDFKHKWSDNYGATVPGGMAYSTKDNTYTNQDGTDDGFYIYFWPEEQYTKDAENATRYVAGFSYFLAANVDDGNPEFMQKFAASNGFELVQASSGGGPAEMIADTASTMSPIFRFQDCEGGLLGHDWRYNIYHYLLNGIAYNRSDGAQDNHTYARYNYENSQHRTKMYFGVSYTYNPYRAITGVAGLIAPYTETNHQLKYTGLTTAAGSFRVANVSIQGNPITSAGITLGIYNPMNMTAGLYTLGDTYQESDLDWGTSRETEIRTHYLLTAGPVTGLEPIREDELLITPDKNPQVGDEYVPVCDMRTPGDYEHPMNFALDTSNKGSCYLYLYLRKDAGGRTKEKNTNHNEYTKKHYVAAIYCGTGKTAEEAIMTLYARASSAWPALAEKFPDLPAQPLVTEFDEIYPVDLSDDTPWYELYHSDTERCDPSNNEWVYGNPGAQQRWGHSESKDAPESSENMEDHAYIGVVRTQYTEETVTIESEQEDGTIKTTDKNVCPAFALLKYYTDSKTASPTLAVGNVNCLLAGGPVQSKEGQYYLFYSTNSATASFSAPITQIDISDTPFVNGFNTSYSCSESDRVNYSLPEYSDLRMRLDEYKYIHTKYDMKDLPYIERLYIGIGNSQKEAYADLIGTTNANAASSVNCNYNSYSDEWIAIGYRRTDKVENSIRDLFLYVGEEPAEEVSLGAYKITQTKVRGKPVTKYTPIEKVYKRINHNLKGGKSEKVSLNRGSNGLGIYLYYTSGGDRLSYVDEEGAEILPVRNIAFSYGDISPAYASKEQLAEVYGATLYGMRIFDIEAYNNMSWEHVLGYEGASAADYSLDGKNGSAFSLNYGQLPSEDNWHAKGDKRVYMYISRGTVDVAGDLIREKAKLGEAGYYQDSTTFGLVTQPE